MHIHRCVRSARINLRLPCIIYLRQLLFFLWLLLAGRRSLTIPIRNKLNHTPSPPGLAALRNPRARPSRFALGGQARLFLGVIYISSLTMSAMAMMGCEVRAGVCLSAAAARSGIGYRLRTSAHRAAAYSSMSALVYMMEQLHICAANMKIVLDALFVCAAGIWVVWRYIHVCLFFIYVFIYLSIYLCMCMCIIYMCTYLYIKIYTCMCVCVSLYTYTHTYVYTISYSYAHTIHYVFICTYNTLHMYVYTYIYTYVYIYIYMCVCVDVICAFADCSGAICN